MMRSKLKYLYTGERFPEDSGTFVYVSEIARKAGISYDILKNRMNIKKARKQSDEITDKELEPKIKIRRVTKNKTSKTQALSRAWLKKKLI